MHRPKTPEDFAQKVQTFYTLPATFHKITQAVDDPDSTIDDISDVISNDQSVAMKVLQLANSAFFAFPSKVETISHALTLIGIQQVRDLIQGTSVIEMFEGLPVEHVTMRSFWEHSIACGLATKIIASLRNEANVERFFVLGLLHDVGRMVFFQHTPDLTTLFLSKSKDEEKLLYKVESEELGYTHADVSSALMERWQFPQRLCQGVKNHHAFEKSDVFAIENAVVHIADVIVHILQIGKSGELFIPPPHKDAWEMLDLDLEVLPILVKELDRQLVETLRIMLPNT